MKRKLLHDFKRCQQYTVFHKIGNTFNIQNCLLLMGYSNLTGGTRFSFTFYMHGLCRKFMQDGCKNATFAMTYR